MSITSSDIDKIANDINPSFNFNTRSLKNHKLSKKDYQAASEQLKTLGFTEGSIKESYKDTKRFSNEGFAFGSSLGSLDSRVYSGKAGTSADYVKKRVEALNEIIQVFQAASNPQLPEGEGAKLIDALLTQSKDAAESGNTNAIHYIEAIEAAKAASKEDNSSKKLMTSFEKSFAYDPDLRADTLRELTKRRDHLKSIETEGFSSALGVVGNVADNSVTVGLQSIGSVGTVKSLAAMKAKGIGSLLSSGLKSLKGLWPAVKEGVETAINFLPPPLKIPARIALGTAVVALTSKTVVAVAESDGWVKAIKDGAHDIFIGDSKSWAHAAISYVVPDIGLLLGGKDWSFYQKQENSALSELQKGIIA